MPIKKASKKTIKNVSKAKPKPKPKQVIDYSDPNRIEPLIFVPSPRDIEIFAYHLNKLNQLADSIELKYFTDEVLAYQVARRFFLDNPKYTHMIILPDDLLVSTGVFEKLINHVRQNKYDVVSAICNLSCLNFKQYNFMLAIPYHNNLAQERLMRNQIADFQYLYQEYDIKTRKKTVSGLQRVLFSGFPFMCISRKVLEQIEFNSTKLLNGLDTRFAMDCFAKRIPIYVDFDLKTLHLRGIEDCENIRRLIFLQFYGIDGKSIKSNINPRFMARQPKTMIITKKGSLAKKTIDLTAEFGDQSLVNNKAGEPVFKGVTKKKQE